MTSQIENKKILKHYDCTIKFMKNQYKNRKKFGKQFVNRSE